MKTLRRFEVVSFFIPLAIQAISQSFTWPLVASVITRGPLGTPGYTAYVQGQVLVLFFGAIGYGLISTGMVFVSSKKSFRNFTKVSLRLAWLAVFFQLLCIIPPIDRWVFEGLLKLDGTLLQVAKWSFLGSIPMQFTFFVRNMPTVILLNHKKTTFLNYATFGRIGLAFVLSKIFTACNLVGWLWGCVCITLPIIVETLAMYVFAYPYLKSLPEESEEKLPSTWYLFRFNMPLSIGGLMLSISGVLLGILMARVDNAPTVLSIHYLLMGIINPLGFAAMRTQSVTIAYPAHKYGPHVARNFALCVGFFFSCIALVLQIPAVSRAYFVGYQNMPPDDAVLATQTLAFIFLLPLLQSLRGHAEGRAAVLRHPSAVMVGQFTYVVVLVSALQYFLSYPIVPSYMFGAFSIFAAIALAWIAVLVATRVILVNSHGKEKFTPAMPAE